MNRPVFVSLNDTLLVDFISEGEDNRDMRILVRILDQLPGLETISYLPDMIEVSD